MKPINFKDSNCVFAKDQPEYLPLPACKIEGVEGEVISCWQLTWLERFKILLKGRFYFSVWTFNRPLQPQRPWIDNPLNGRRVDESPKPSIPFPNKYG